MVELFEITFVDDTKIWAHGNLKNKILDCSTITFGTLGRGYATEFRKLFNRDLNTCCYVASVLQDNKIVKEYKAI